jgi:hypothetical protein
VRPILADAVDLARRALLELEPSGVGAHLGVIAEDESAATHRFAATLPGYRGWQWAVVVAAPPGAGHATVSESALLPGPEALVAPEFVPWEQRVRPGDLAPGDLLAPPEGDPRLVPGYVATGDPVVDEVAYEIGLGRTKVLSREGREEAAERWYAEHGPDTEMAKAAPATCGSCGFYLPLAGALRAAFGVCGNVMGADGQVVHVAYGCGAHSDTEIPTGGGSPLYEAYDDAAIELISLAPEHSRAQQDSAKAATRGERRGAVAEQAEKATEITDGRMDSGTAEDATPAPDTAVAGAAEVAEGAAVAGDAADVENVGVSQDAVDIETTPVAGDSAVIEVAGAAEGVAVADSPAAADESGSDIVSADAPGRPEPSVADAPVAEHDSGANTDDAPEAEARPEIQSSPRN